MRELISLLLNIIWFLTAGLALFLGYVVAGILACVLIVTIPFGVASFRIAGFVVWPFGREALRDPSPSVLGTLANVIWFLVAGWWLALAHVTTALVQVVTIIGIPLAWANLKLIPTTCFPFGTRIVSSAKARASLVSFASRS